VYHGLADPEAEGARIICHLCLGGGCEYCHGEGAVVVSGRITEGVGEEARCLFAAYRWLKDYNILPRSGGVEKQAARFLEAVELIDMAAQAARSMAEKLKAEIDRVNEMQKWGRNGR